MPSAIAKSVGAVSALVAAAVGASAIGSPPAALASAQGGTQPQAAAIQAAAPAPAPAPSAEPEAAPQPANEGGPVRLTGLAGANLNLAMEQAGVPGPIAAEYLRALATQIRLADGISVADRFDLVMLQGQLLYAGLDRVGASDVMLMRWTVQGQSGWTDASGTGGAAEAMRMPVAASVSSSFGMRVHPIRGSHRFHRGVDLRASAGTPIRASASGRVVHAGWNGGYGRQVLVDHGGGLATRYAHMSRLSARPGAQVNSGEVIGYVGSSGLSTGPHLHYEVLQNGKPVNPLKTRFAGKPGLEREERAEFNATLRQLLTGGARS